MPRITQEEKERNRRRIVEAASVMFRESGADQVGIEQLMQRAGLTRGGFYNHFDSKEALVAEVCRATFGEALGRLARFLEERSGGGERGAGDPAAGGGEPDVETLLAVARLYLSAQHRDELSSACPTATLPLDAARHSAETQQEYANGIRGYLSTFMELFGRAPEARGRSIRLLTSMVGAMVVARAVRAAEPELADEILALGYDTAAHLVSERREEADPEL